MFHEQRPSVVITKTIGGELTGSTVYTLKEVPFEDTEIIEEVIIRRRRVPKRKSTDMDGDCFIPRKLAEQPCLFDGWDWKRHPVAHMHCPCPKHSIWI